MTARKRDSLRPGPVWRNPQSRWQARQGDQGMRLYAIVFIGSAIMVVASLVQLARAFGL